MSDPQTAERTGEDHESAENIEPEAPAPSSCDASGHTGEPTTLPAPPTTTWTAANGAKPDDISKQSPYMYDLIKAWQEPCRRRYASLLEKFTQVNKCKIKESYMAEHAHAGVVLAAIKGGVTTIFLSYSSGTVDARFAHVIMSLLGHQREGSILLKDKSQDIFVQEIYTVIEYLLRVLDWNSSPIKIPQDSAEHQAHMAERKERMTKAIESASEDCRKIERKLKESASRAALTKYLIGLPIGFVVAVLLVAFSAMFEYEIGYLANTSTVSLCLTAGAVGALLSVLARITRVQQLRVRTDLGTGMTIFAGSCRPIVGAAFGAVLYLLFLGGLVPLVPSSLKDTTLFYAGIAFFAGFSERWAQDTIVRSVPKGQSKSPGED